VGQQPDDRPIGNGEELTLTQRSARRRSYALARGDQVVGRWHRWAIEGGDGVLLDFTAHQGLIRSSVRITARQELPEPDGLLLCVIGGFLALRNLQAEADGSAAAGGIVAAGS
jgi:hypothetical protein